MDTREISLPVKDRIAAPLVSILIPAYNAERWIQEAIESALAQAYPAKEVIVADDGSTDDTANVVRRFGDRIQFVQLDHAGGNATRNALLGRARGEWLQYLDADDYLLPNKVADQIGFLAARDYAFDVVYSPFYLRHELEGTEVAVRPDPHGSHTEHFLAWGPFWTGSLLLRRSAIVEVGGWKDDQPRCQEHELLLRLIRAEKKFGYRDQPHAVYRNHGTDTVSRKLPLQTIRMRMELTDQCVDFLSRSKTLTRYHRKALYVARMEAARSAWPFDRSYARELATKAVAAGRWWNTGSPALPLRFQLAHFSLGFDRAEALATRQRHKGFVNRQTLA
jgi:glycosyltransferase involved in cell wall biosynthesis